MTSQQDQMQVDMEVARAIDMDVNGMFEMSRARVTQTPEQKLFFSRLYKLARSRETRESAVRFAVEAYRSQDLHWDSLPRVLRLNERVQIACMRRLILNLNIVNRMSLTDHRLNMDEYMTKFNIWNLKEQSLNLSLEWKCAVLEIWPKAIFQMIARTSEYDAMVDAVCRACEMSSMNRYADMYHQMYCRDIPAHLKLFERIAEVCPAIMLHCHSYDTPLEVLHACERVLRKNPGKAYSFVVDRVKFHIINVEYIMEVFPRLISDSDHIRIYHLNPSGFEYPNCNQLHVLSCAKAVAKDFSIQLHIPDIIQRHPAYILYLAEHQPLYTLANIPDKASLSLDTMKKLLKFYPHTLWYHLTELSEFSLWSETCILPLYMSMTCADASRRTVPFLPLDLLHTIVDMCMEQ